MKLDQRLEPPVFFIGGFTMQILSGIRGKGATISWHHGSSGKLTVTVSGDFPAQSMSFSDLSKDPERALSEAISGAYSLIDKIQNMSHG